MIAIEDNDIKAQNEIDEAREQYREDPIGFAVNVLGMKSDWIWSKMVELAEGVRDHQKVAIRAGHFVSKTYSLGRLVVPWFKTCFLPSTVITTAPSDNQVKNQLWREIHAAYYGSRVKLGGNMTSLMWDCKPNNDILDELSPESRQDWEKNFAIGFSTSPDSNVEHATKMQGWHNEWVLVVIDEACGMLPQIWRTAVEGLINDEQCKIVAIGNPTDPESDFAKACYSSDPEENEGTEPYISDEGWYVITIDARQNPNYIQRKRVIPGLASYEWVQSIIKKYGKDGDGTRYRVKGLFPTYKEGTYYGKYLAQAKKDKRVGTYRIEPTAPVYTISDTGDMYTATILVQFIKNSIRIVGEYWDYEGHGLKGWANNLQERKLIYGEHYAGPELAYGTAGRAQTGKSMIDMSEELGYPLVPVLAHSFDDGIEAGRSIWPLLEIDKDNCPIFIKAASGYGKKKNQSLSTNENTVYYDQPAKTWHRHMMDALRHLAILYRFMEINGEYIGSTIPVPVRDDAHSYEVESEPLSARSL